MLARQYDIHASTLGFEGETTFLRYDSLQGRHAGMISYCPSYLHLFEQSYSL